MHLAVFVANGDILARAKNMRAETVSAFVVIFRRLIVVEDPSTVLRSARTMQKKAVLVILAFRKSSHAAKIAMLFPQGGIDMACTVERSGELVAVPRGALRELLGAGEVEPDTFETARQVRHGLSPATAIIVVILPRSGKGIDWCRPATLI
jgi:hypothetical protein